jgi:hypothetical protein
MRPHLWSLQLGAERVIAYLEDLGVNGVEVSIVDGSGLTISRDRFIAIEFAREWAALRHAQFVAEGWKDVSDEK